MSYAANLGSQLKQAGVMTRTGELATFLLNRLSGKARLGHKLLNAGVSGRLQNLRQTHAIPGAAARPGIAPDELGALMARRSAKFDQLASQARNTRMGQIGAGTLGLGLTGGAMAASDALQPQQANQQS